jgi:DNA-binding response OmpR family regulator
LLRRSRTERAATGPPRVLVVQDDRDALELLCRVLARAGYDVLPAATHDDAVGIAAGEHPDVAVLDLAGTGANLKLLDALRQSHDSAVAAVRVVLLARQRSNRMFSWQSGIDGFLDRPFHADDLVAEVAAVLARPNADRPRHRREEHERARVEGGRRTGE